MSVFRKFYVHSRNKSCSIVSRFYTKHLQNNDEIKSNNADTCPEEIEKKISVGIIGGGMTPIYTAVLLKQLKALRTINIVDVSNSLAGAVFDASHIDTKAKLRYYRRSSLKEALSNVDIIALMDNADGRILSTEPKMQLLMSSSYVRDMAEDICKINSSALLAIFVRPVTATVPLVSEIFNNRKCWDPNKILGSVAIDTMRIQSMAANLFHLNPSFLTIPVVAGADPNTAVPLLTTAQPLNYISEEQEKLLIDQLKSCDKDLEDSAYNFQGPAMSSGVAAATFISMLTRALLGESNIKCSAYVRSNIIPSCRYFANEVELGPCGIKANYELPKVSSMAVNLIQRAIPMITELTDIACRTAASPNESVTNEV